MTRRSHAFLGAVAYGSEAVSCMMGRVRPWKGRNTFRAAARKASKSRFGNRAWGPSVPSEARNVARVAHPDSLRTLRPRDPGFKGELSI